MNANSNSLPKWLLIITSLFSLMEIMVALSLFFSPQSVLEKVDLSAKGVIYIVYMWAARQLALGIIFAYSLYKRSNPMLFIAYLFFCVMFIGDVFIGFLQKEYALVVSAAILALLSVFILNKLKIVNNQS